ncbi:MAG TPA: ferredoxin [Candidatus Latescibacteria bacterium]|nr:ferredoxin [Candidatus Latescibacterota bacterium]
MKVKPDTGWRDLPCGGVIVEPGSAAEYPTGDWRTYRPTRDENKCTNCLLCWICCPDSSIMVEDGRIIGIDYKHCKGCGICAQVCPPKIKAIMMVEEERSSSSKGPM